MHVLVVDDDASTRLGGAGALTDEGHEAVPAPDGPGALALLADWRPDVILLDLWLPGMDGWAVIEAYQQLAPPHAPVVLLTAATVGTAGLVGGRPLPPAAGTLAKPFDLDDLLALVRQ